LNSRRLFNWFFYGHLQIALAATGLGWLTLQLAYDSQTWASDTPVLAFLFFSTLGVYTLHRYLSFQRAGVRPTSKRYNIVSRHPAASLVIGIGSMATAGIIGLPFIDAMWGSLLWATPLTIFYLTPPIKGWPRLRDLPYVKVIWVAWAWTLMTAQLPIDIMSDAINQAASGEIHCFAGCGSPQAPWPYELIIRFLFTGSIALLFDFRDTVLDKSQGVKTMANMHPKSTRWIITLAMLFSCYLLWSINGYKQSFTSLATIAYAGVLCAAWLTNETRSEDWFAVVINGLLLGPVVGMVVYSYYYSQ
jgi:hypothetical protein